jgi:hypothetical protein
MECLEAGRLDEIGVDLARVGLGAGTICSKDLRLRCSFEGPISVVEGQGVNHPLQSRKVT